MTEREKPDKDQDSWEDLNTQRQGKVGGGTPDYEKGQSSPINDKEFDNKDSSW